MGKIFSGEFGIGNDPITNALDKKLGNVLDAISKKC